MDFLKAILDGELFAKLETAINAYNGNPENKDKQIKLGNLSSGEYIGRGKHDSEIERLTAQLTGKDTELEAANKLIADFQKATKGNEEMQSKFTEYQNQVQQLQAQLAETKLNSAVKVWLMGEKALDVDYLTYKLTEKLKADGKTLELDETENIKGRDDLLSGLKTQFPNMFESGVDGRKILDGGKLPETDKDSGTMTKAEFLRKPYAERAAYAAQNPDAYKTMMAK